MSDVSTEKKTVELEMGLQELKRLLNMSECSMIVLQPTAQMEVLFANERFFSDIQYSKEEFSEQCGNSIMSLIPEDDKQKIKNLIARQTAMGGQLRLEHRIMTKRGNTLWVSTHANMVNVEGQVYYYASSMDITQTKRSLVDAYQAKRDMELIANSIPGGVIKLRMTDYRLLYANDGFYRLSGYTKEEYQVEFDGCADQVIHPADREMVQKHASAAVENHGLIGFEYRIISKSGEERWSYVNGCRIDDDEGQPVYLCVIMDITKRKKLERQFEEVAKRTELLAQFMRETTWTYDIKTGKLYRSGNLGDTYSNDSVLEDLFHKEQLIEIMHPDDIERFREELRRREEKLGNDKSIYRIKDKTGQYRRMEVGTISISTSGEEKPDRIFGITRLLDGTALGQPESELEAADNTVQLQNKLVRMAKSSQAKVEDTLTGLVPYADFLTKAGAMLSERTEKDNYALLCADIDEFSKYTHHYGFSISNEILKQFSKVIQRYVLKGGVCSRVDGDYFVAIFSYEDHKSLLKILSEMMRYQDELKKDQSQITFDTTNGLYLVEPEDTEIGDMLEKADLARRSIKGIKGNHYAIYTDDLQQQRFKEDQIIHEIFEAMEKQTIDICYLPRIRDNKDDVVGCKVVARIQLQDGQYLEMDKMMRYIERTGNQDKFSFYILNQVCCNIGAWKARGNDVIRFSVEMTASQLSGRNAFETIEDIVVKQNKLEPKDLVIEVQERYFANMTSAMQITLERLCKKGYRVVISRFGSHLTTVHTLRTLPVTGIKFHGEYLGEGMNADRDKVIMKNIVNMAKELGIRVACGGVHTRLQEEYAKAIGCEMFEGDYYYSAMRGNVFEKCFFPPN
ncbi:MAG: EAL domain-containing protein [Lachnospiraceae bacterium]|nr:EAL domain-containing protein [Lachnospiraceae bacterium]